MDGASLFKKVPLAFVVGLIVGLFTTFVMQNLWNWFVAPAFNIHEILFWQMYGVFLLVRYILDQVKNPTDDVNREITLSLLDVCVPENRREEAREIITKKTEDIWPRAFKHAFSELIGGAITLIIGWGVHTFLL